MKKETLGFIAMLSSLVYFAIGLPVQIWKIYEAKSTEGVSLFAEITLLVTTAMWCTYSRVLKDKYILVSNAPGVVCTLVILYQFWLYRK